jgi:hypothetical protein
MFLVLNGDKSILILGKVTALSTSRMTSSIPHVYSMLLYAFRKTDFNSFVINHRLLIFPFNLPLWNSITAWSRAFLKSLKCQQVFCYLWNPKIYCFVRNSSPLSYDPLRILTPGVFKVYFNNPPSMPWFPRWSLTFNISIGIFTYFYARPQHNYENRLFGS